MILFIQILQVAQDNSEAFKDIATIVGVVVALLGVGLSWYNTRRTIQKSADNTRLTVEKSAENTRRTLEQSLKAAQREEIHNKLNSFYGPYLQLQGVGQILSDLFRERRGKDFRTLTALLRGETFEGNDRMLLEEILQINEERNKLILTQSGLVDDRDLQELLWKASAHFRIIRLAYQANHKGKGGLVGEVDRFEDYVYPNALNPKIKEQIHILQKRLSELNSM